MVTNENTEENPKKRSRLFGRKSAVETANTQSDAAPPTPESVEQPVAESTPPKRTRTAAKSAASHVAASDSPGETAVDDSEAAPKASRSRAK